MEIPTSYPCLKLSCGRWFAKKSHRLLHMDAKHSELSADVAPSSPAALFVTDRSSSPSLDSGPDFSFSGERDAEDPFPGVFPEVAIEGPAASPIPAPMGSDFQEDPVPETPIVEEQRINCGSSSNEEEGPHRHDEGNELRFFGVDDRPFYRRHHRVLSGKPCDAQGNYLPPGVPPAQDSHEMHDWTPFSSQIQFELADFLYRRDQMPGTNINILLKLMNEMSDNNGTSCFKNNAEMYHAIDAITVGGVKWEACTVQYNGPLPEQNVPPWMLTKHEVHFRDPRLVIKAMLSNTDYKDEFDYAPYREYDADNLQRFHHFMSGEWAWRQATILEKNKAFHGAMIVPVILGSDKTTTSVATGDNEYYPLYISIGNVHNNVRRAHRDAVEVVGFLSVAKTTRECKDDARYRRFRRQLLQSSLGMILSRLEEGAASPLVMRCPDGHYRRVVFRLGPYLADYPEQAMIANIVSGWCPKCEEPDLGSGESGTPRSQERTEILSTIHELSYLWQNHGIVGDMTPFTKEFPDADIHELIAPDILHQIIKGVFKDHLVTWVGNYLTITHGKSRAQAILDDIDRRISLAPPFAGLRRFPVGRGFKQWTGDDSKALMKVYISAIEGHVPDDMVRTFRALLEVCYIIRREYIGEGTLKELEDALGRFHECREVFKETGVRKDFHLPRQHALVHYLDLIRLFGAPNGLCTSITENAHIRLVKEPWRRSNRNDPLEQMLETNTRVSQLGAARRTYVHRGMLVNPIVPDKAQLTQAGDDVLENAAPALSEDDPIQGIIDGPPTKTFVKLAKTKKGQDTVEKLAQAVNQPELPSLIQEFLGDQLDDCNIHINEVEEIYLHDSAIAMIYSPSDPSGIGGMRKERIRARRSWRHGKGRYDTVFVRTENDPVAIGRVCLFFQFSYNGTKYPSALIHWFMKPESQPSELNGMWVVEPMRNPDSSPVASIVSVDALIRAAHLLPAFATDKFVDKDIRFDETLDYFDTFYVNRYVDHHSFLIL